jgi:archaeosine-15-forming tRNA-guanine transglycosylase
MTHEELEQTVEILRELAMSTPQGRAVFAHIYTTSDDLRAKGLVIIAENVRQRLAVGRALATRMHDGVKP